MILMHAADVAHGKRVFGSRHRDRRGPVTSAWNELSALRTANRISCPAPAGATAALPFHFQPQRNRTHSLLPFGRCDRRPGNDAARLAVKIRTLTLFGHFPLAPVGFGRLGI